MTNPSQEKTLRDEFAMACHHDGAVKWDGKIFCHICNPPSEVVKDVFTKAWKEEE